MIKIKSPDRKWIASFSKSLLVIIFLFLCQKAKTQIYIGEGTCVYVLDDTALDAEAISVEGKGKLISNKTANDEKAVKVALQVKKNRPDEQIKKSETKSKKEKQYEKIVKNSYIFQQKRNNSQISVETSSSCCFVIPSPLTIKKIIHPVYFAKNSLELYVYTNHAVNPNFNNSKIGSSDHKKRFDIRPPPLYFVYPR
ncbi:hypothetical protein [Chryseobacterium candidae]|uniref:Uncharacterized protein n=1 Tax=Chryseobacterium candidae TaxID=1978493 RepID=A0ABY2RCP2_9FLAO|nr:hypothetical protein [Chryseobacterium candidae]THV63377.1 hypothetical protein EK417_00680 [Chryseobacterium candidae]